jgi:hypothetical protein
LRTEAPTARPYTSSPPYTATPHGLSGEAALALLALAACGGGSGSSSPVDSPSVDPPESPRATLGSATLTWRAPTRHEDGSELHTLAGFRIYYGQDSSNLTGQLEIPGPRIQTATIEELTQGTWYFAVTAYTTAGLESSLSNVVSKTIG